MDESRQVIPESREDVSVDEDVRKAHGDVLSGPREVLFDVLWAVGEARVVTQETRQVVAESGEEIPIERDVLFDGGAASGSPLDYRMTRG